MVAAPPFALERERESGLAPDDAGEFGVSGVFQVSHGSSLKC